MTHQVVRSAQPLKRGPSNAARRLNVKLLVKAGKSLAAAREQAGAMQFDASPKRRRRAWKRLSKRTIIRRRLPYWTGEVPTIAMAESQITQTKLDSRTIPMTAHDVDWSWKTTESAV